MSKTLIFRPDKLLMLPYILGFAIVGLLTFLNYFYSSAGSQSLLLQLTPIIIWALVTLFHYRRFRSERYMVSDHSIQIQTHNDDTTISLVNIRAVKGIPYSLLRFKKLGKIVITANGRQYTLKGIEDASSTATIIWQAAEAAVARQNNRNRPANFQPPTNAAGTLELMNDLVGLWQQGMISDEEYGKEIERLKD